ncbi:peptide chain release factor N(5)-glutamine methyltransferase [Fibrobacterota bacterium]
MAELSLIEILNKTAEHFKKKGIRNPRLDAQLLLATALKLNRIDLYLNYDRPLSKGELDAMREMVRRRSAREPLQHILGRVQFRELILNVDKRALVPRQETELLIDHVKDVEHQLETAGHPRKDLTALDVGVGSGAVYLSIKREIPQITTFGVELSADALALARENAELNTLKLDDNLVQGDTFQPFAPGQKWDLIVSNPPYVSRQEFDTLDPEVKFWDPPSALIGGDTGTEYPAKLIRESFDRTCSGGFLIMEIGEEQGSFLVEEARRCRWEVSRVKRDYNGKERFLILKRQ